MGLLWGAVKRVKGNPSTMRGRHLLAYLARGAGCADVRCKIVDDTLLKTMRKSWFARFAGGRGNK